MKNPRSYKQLLIFYLEMNTIGQLGEFNRKYFPEDYIDMQRELEEIRKAVEGDV